MKIPINNDYQLGADKRQWIIYEPKMRKGEKCWEGKHFFANPQNAVNFLGNMMVRESDAQTLVDALAEIDRVATLLTHALTLEFNIERKVK